jgi:hypothetical protein
MECGFTFIRRCILRFRRRLPGSARADGEFARPDSLAIRYAECVTCWIRSTSLPDGTTSCWQRGIRKSSESSPRGRKQILWGKQRQSRMKMKWPSFGRATATPKVSNNPLGTTGAISRGAALSSSHDSDRPAATAISLLRGRPHPLCQRQPPHATQHSEILCEAAPQARASVQKRRAERTKPAGLSEWKPG